MNRPLNSRAMIYEGTNSLTIEIPVFKNPFAILVFAFLLLILFYGLAFSSGYLYGVFEAAPKFEIFPFFPVVRFFVVIIIFFLVFSFLLWIIAGREILTFSDNILIVTRKNSIFFSPKMFNLKESTNFKFNFLARGSNIYQNSITNPWKINNKGSIMFFYNYQVITVANGIQEDEALFLLDFLRKKGFID
jgi:hypothetical protein